jgi:hypothetical protein
MRCGEPPLRFTIYVLFVFIDSFALRAGRRAAIAELGR